jgi:hypothetical protein
MKTTKQKTIALPKGSKLNKELNGKYANDPVVIAKTERARKLLEEHPFPEHLVNQK